MKVVIYRDGGNIYMGTWPTKPLSDWKDLGESVGALWMYKGRNYYGGEWRQVIVYTVEQWDEAELARRKENGFINIHEYKLLDVGD